MKQNLRILSSIIIIFYLKHIIVCIEKGDFTFHFTQYSWPFIIVFLSYSYCLFLLCTL